MKTTQSRQKSYGDQRWRDLEFHVGYHVFVKVALMKGVMRFGKKGKISPRYIRPFEILERVGKLAYRVSLPLNLARIHNVFHVSMLRKYMPIHSHVLNYEPIQLTPHLSFEEKPSQTLDRQEKRLQNKVIKMVKVKSLNHSEEEATWKTETETEMRRSFMLRILVVQLLDSRLAEGVRDKGQIDGFMSGVRMNEPSAREFAVEVFRLLASVLSV
ncbi:uncharacterized protein [Primulina eburnea]|uniref:uncharacterized protein n=1 Tax=Primulina eburnea TaxID=1245227 RepID=UPI003C6C53EF